MSGFADLKAARPIRFVIAVTVYRALWWPVAAVLIPFVVLGAFVDWLSWTAFPAIARTFQPGGAWIHERTLDAGNLVLGYRPSKDRPQ